MASGSMEVLNTGAAEGGGVGLDEPKKMTREDWRKKKELEEQRKLGNAPAEVDEEGKDINPHIPQYISSVPWYIDPSKRPTLKHQRPQIEKQKQFVSLGDWYKRGVQEGSITTRYRKGACENCGAMTHKKKDCMERPRKVGAKFTGTNIAPDEHSQPQLGFDYDGKRDRWNGYNPEEHMRIVEEYSKVDLAKRTLKAQKLQDELASGKLMEQANSPRNQWGEEEPNSQTERDHNSEDEDEDKYADDIDMPGQNFDSKRRITVRNLRIREDIAKYLRNLDPNSAYYDPKTRAMRENPYANTGKNPDEVGYAGDNFVRYSGDTISMAQTQMFAWEAYEKGSEVHLQADPTKLELLHKSFKVKKEDFKQQQKESILEKYGGQEHLNAPVRELLLAQTEDYVEYSRHGAVIKGQEKAIARSKYEEDVLINNHTCIWGSYWRDGQWGYKCCHSFVKFSYCTGETGKQTNTSNVSLVEAEDFKEEEIEIPTKTLLEMYREKQKEEKKKKKKQHKKSRSSDSEDDDAKKKEKLKKALSAEEARLKQVQALLQMDERKRPYNSLYEVREPTEEEMEAYRMKRQRPDDPMASFLGQ
ncbi:pre-mRNA-splicing factor SLU7 [Latimeria chalumnae]|uniref:Pre-mRNA-splicing factor SLU7 n=1 Tax=Latimeria chalumnae TaxID=7897 RepID=H3API7_LATCH|nr:PREDICTED: pre-mRNA-splicing factor SLU7 [Latimeria chalumnae]|eukprot:XP_006002644.1 PREDICTED: pre-mRNA-splicing factor SLU7 [Latimeria chalumnae]